MTGQDISLDDIRKEIDSIDDGIVELLARRAAAQGKIKARKAADGSLAVSPVRPAREAEILRRIVARGRGAVSSDLLVRLWRVILSSSALSQAAIRVHAPVSVVQSCELGRMVAGHFGPLPVVEHRSAPGALQALASSPGDLAVVETAGDWAASLAVAGGAGVVGVLPVLKNGPPPLLVFGHAQPQPTGDDCTLYVVRPGDPEPPGTGRWTVHSGGLNVICVGGFASPAPVSGHAVIAGRFADQIES